MAKAHERPEHPKPRTRHPAVGLGLYALLTVCSAVVGALWGWETPVACVLTVCAAYLVYVGVRWSPTRFLLAVGVILAASICCSAAR